MLQSTLRAIFAFAILNVEMLPSFSIPTNSHDLFASVKLGISDEERLETTTESFDSLSFRLFGVSQVLNEEKIKSQSPKHHYRPTIPNKNDLAPRKNVSDFFYYKENVTDYPDISKIEHLLKKFEHLFDVNELDAKTLLVPNPEIYISLCGNEPINISAAKEVMNKKGEKVFLVNTDKYEQAIVGEICGNFEDTTCGNYLKNFHEGYEPICKQNYIFRKMVVMKKGEEKSEPYTDEIPIPGCCECVLKDKSLM